MKKDEYLREFLHQKQFDHWRTWYGLNPPFGTIPDLDRREPSLKTPTADAAPIGEPLELGLSSTR
jgi:hypothetical protein